MFAPKTSGKSFVPYQLRKNSQLLGNQPRLSTTDTLGQRRICQNCQNRCVIGAGFPTGFLTDCASLEAKILFNAGSTVMPQKLHGQEVGNFCIKYVPTVTMEDGTAFLSKEKRKEEEKEDPASQVEKEESTHLSAAEGAQNFVASKNGGKYYKAGSSGEKRIRPENRVYFETALDAEMAGYDKAAA